MAVTSFTWQRKRTGAVQVAVMTSAIVASASRSVRVVAMVWYV